jgi:hypothetical protein
MVLQSQLQHKQHKQKQHKQQALGRCAMHHGVKMHGADAGASVYIIQQLNSNWSAAAAEWFAHLQLLAWRAFRKVQAALYVPSSPWYVSLE